MAHERLSPRQKMIGMMYLVLTAMLALNVSKEAVEAFKKVDKGLTLTVANYIKKNNLIYTEFDRAAAENPTKAGKFKTDAYDVKVRADEIFDFIQSLKVEIITKAEGPETPAVKGTEVIIEEVKRIDENNVPSEILIGANEDGKANTLKALMKEYRESLIEKLEGKNPSAEESLRQVLNTDDGKDPSGETERWENLNFQTLPLVAVITILSKMQVDVRNAETEVLNYLYSQIDAASFKFNKLTAVVIPNSNYITQGNDYQAEVFLSATDTTQKPAITVGGTELPIDEAGKGLYKVRATTTGQKNWGGLISLKAPDGTTKTYPFSSSFVVGEPNVIVSPTAMNVMYTGIDNPIDVSVPGVSPDKIKVRAVNGTYTTGKVKNSKGEFFKGSGIVKPDPDAKIVQVLVTADIGGKPMQLAPYDFRVKPLPIPVAQFAQRSSGDVPKNLAMAQQGVIAVLPDFDFNLNYTVTGFSILYTDTRGDFEEPSTSWTLTAKQKDLINRLTRGKNLIIKDIKALGPDGKIKDLPIVLLKIQ